jgi:hypothetical protein
MNPLFFQARPLPCHDVYGLLQGRARHRRVRHGLLLEREAALESGAPKMKTADLFDVA